MTSKSIADGCAPSQPTTVRHTPLTAMDAPCTRSSAIVDAASVSTAESPRDSTRDDLADLLDDPGEHRLLPLRPDSAGRRS